MKESQAQVFRVLVLGAMRHCSYLLDPDISLDMHAAAMTSSNSLSWSVWHLEAFKFNKKHSLLSYASRSILPMNVCI